MAPVSITLLFLLLSQVIPAATELETPPEPTSMMIVGRGKSKQDPPSPSPRPWRLLHAAGRGLLAQDKGETRSPAPGMAPCGAGLEVGTPPPTLLGREDAAFPVLELGQLHPTGPSVTHGAAPQELFPSSVSQWEAPRLEQHPEDPPIALAHVCWVLPHGFPTESMLPTP